MKNALLLALLSVLLMGFVVGCIGCSTEKKIQKAKQLLEDSGELAGFCADAYPVKDSVVVKDSVHFDTLYYGEVFIDTVTKNDTVRITKTVPQIVTKTVTQVKEVFRENTARIAQITSLSDKQHRIIQDLIAETGVQQAEIKRLKDLMRGKIRIPIWWLIAIGAFAFRSQLFKLVKTVI